MSYAKYSKTDAIVSLKKFYERYGTVSQYLYLRVGWKPSPNTFNTLFGSWNNAVKAAGLKIEKYVPTDEEREHYSKEDVLNMVRDHINENSKLIFLNHYKEEGLFPTTDMVISRFGNWRNAMLALAIDMDKPGMRGKTKARFSVAEAAVNEAKKKWELEDNKG